ncbi:MAG: tetratricopeptide repeat protein [Campylobacterota bacterium]|nr:tetratricopeptide repeat protein [Campylobacterota bacterium]
MNQTKKRLKIINLAISITDIETIQLQILKLTPLKTDVKVQEIIKELQIESYAQAQLLIKQYIEMPNEEIMQRTTQEEKIQEKNIINKLDLFVNPTEEPVETKEEVFDFSTLEAELAQMDTKDEKKKKDANFEALLNLDANDVLAGNIDINIKAPHVSKKEVSLDTQADEDSELTENSVNPNNAEIKLKTFAEVIPKHYESIAYINQKFQNMYTQYPSIENSEEVYASVDTWLSKIQNDGYTPEDIEAMIVHIEELTKEKKSEEAAQLLLVTGSTKSKFAQFMLARALYKGDVLQRNLSESFTLIYRLALDDNYPEAICDLAQFYEKGIGTEKDLKKAEELYKEAMELGITRATSHYKRVNKKNLGFFSFLKK